MNDERPTRTEGILVKNWLTGSIFSAVATTLTFCLGFVHSQRLLWGATLFVVGLLSFNAGDALMAALGIQSAERRPVRFLLWTRICYTPLKWTCLRITSVDFPTPFGTALVP